MKQALEALELVVVDVKTTPNAYEAQRQSITSLRQAIEQAESKAKEQAKTDSFLRQLDEAIEQAEKQEPVAWMCSDESLVHKGYSRFSRNCEGDWNIPLYTTPQPQREWVGLNANEYAAFYNQFAKYQEENADVSGWFEFAEAIEAKLKEKNT